MSMNFASQASAPAVEELTYVVAGMTCDHCRAAVAEEVGGVAGVGSVEVDLGTKRVRVRGDGLVDADVRAAVEEAGYEAVPA
jgi:copper chaperone CopZ